MPTPPPTSSGAAAVAAARRSRSRAGRAATARRPRRSSHSRAVPGPTSSSRNCELAAASARAARRTRAAGTGARRRPHPTARRRRACRTGRAAAAGRRGRRSAARRRRRARAVRARATRRRSGGASVRRPSSVVPVGGAHATAARRPRRDGPRGAAPGARAPRLAAPRRGDRARGRHRAGHRRDARDPARDRGAADLPAVGARAGAGGRVDDESHLAALDPVERRSASPRRSCCSGSTGMPIRLIACAVPLVATISKPRSCSAIATPAAAGLSPSVTVMKTVPLVGQLRAGGRLRLRERGREVARDAHHLAGRAHLRPEQRVGAGEAVERQHRLLDADVRRRPGPRGRPGRRSARRA